MILLLQAIGYCSRYWLQIQQQETFRSLISILLQKKFAGNTGCNDLSGSFFIMKDSLAFNEHVIATRKMCQGYNEKAFIDNLIKTNHYKIVDGVLQLMNDQTILSKWTRKSDTNKSNKV